MQPWLSVITCTAREEPRFDLMAASLGPAAASLEWIVVDALLWYDETSRKHELLASMGKHLIPGRHLPPKPTPWQGPNRSPSLSADLPHLNNARNTGIIEARGDYLLFVDDCSVLAGPWLQCVQRARDLGAASQFSYHDFWHEDEEPRGQVDGAIMDVNGLSFCGNGVGCPLAGALAINGFDEDFAGVAGDNDVEFFVRLERTGIPMKRFPMAIVAELAGGHADAHVPRHRDPRRTRLRRLQRDKGRIQPYAQQISLESARLTK